MKQVLTVAEYAKLHSISEMTVIRKIKKGEIKGFKLSSRYFIGEITDYYKIQENIVLIPLSKGKEAIIDKEDFPKISQYVWYYGNYAITRSNATELLHMHHLILEISVNDLKNKGLCVDHINRNKLDNRKSNLRLISHRDNILNRDYHTQHQHSKYIGVCKHGKNLFRTKLRINYQWVEIGCSEDQHFLAKLYDAVRLYFDPEYASLNFPTDSTQPLSPNEAKELLKQHNNHLKNSKHALN